MTPLICLATAIFFEARGEPIDAQTLVAEVVVNRVHDDRYPDTVCDVVFEDKQFSFTHDGKSDDMAKYDTFFDVEAQETSLSIAQEVLYNQEVTLTSSTHYHTVHVEPDWSTVYTVDGIYGTHIFYTNYTPWR
tara:strand:- start:43 stop:441 length:399 start_codon:yes stop_codon:yes gene_type:complete